MFEHRQRLAPDFAPTLRDDARLHDDGDDWETSRVALLKTRLKSLFGASALRRALAIVPLAILGYAIAWLVYFKPPQIVTAKSAGEAKPEVTRAAAPIEPPPPEVADARPAPTQMPAPAQVTTPVAPAATAAVAVPSRALSKDEIKELQGKLGVAGFAAGPIDGVIGPQTQAALRRYAEARSLAKPDATEQTLLRLRSETQASH